MLYHDDLAAFRRMMRSFLERGADGYCIWDGWNTIDENHRDRKIGDIGFRDWAGPEQVPKDPPCRLVNVLEVNGFSINYYDTHEID